MEKSGFSPVSINTVIRQVRGARVILDSDLARIYGVPTSRLNEAVKRNRTRFPEDFRFQLTSDELSSLISHFAISKKGRGGRRTLPYAFTEHGALMAANVLNSDRAVLMSIFIVRAFVKLRESVATDRALAGKLDQLERELTGRLNTHERVIGYVLGELRKLMEPVPLPVPKRKPIGFRKDDE